MNAKNIESNELDRSLKTQPTLTKTLKVKVDVSKEKVEAFRELTARYKETANFVSKWVFENDFPLNYAVISREIYYELRALFGLKSQLTQSTMRTVTGAYKTVQTQLARKPYRYKDENGVWQKIPRTLEWLQKPIQFKKPFADLVHNRDYSFVENGELVSINTLSGRVRCTYDKSRVDEILAQGATLGGAKLLERCGKWYLHIAYEIHVPEEVKASEVIHVVGIDRGIRNLAVAYDERGKTTFFDGKAIRAKREQFARLREKLQKKNTKSTKRLLKRLEQRENRWMTDANHVLTRALVDRYGANTVFVLEDLEGVSFRKKSLENERSLGNDRCVHGRSTSSSSSWNTRHGRSAQRCSKSLLRTRLSGVPDAERLRKTNEIGITTSTIAPVDSARTTTALPRSTSSSSARSGCREKAPRGSINQRESWAENLLISD